MAGVAQGELFADETIQSDPAETDPIIAVLNAAQEPTDEGYQPDAPNEPSL